MSGGVDSSVAAAVLKEQGYEVVGATMRLWSYSDGCGQNEGCCSEAAVEDARRVCDKLGIEFYVMNFKELFKEKVVDYFVREYVNGRTPNPCIACNQYLKFDAMLNKALAMGFDYVATGHYAKIERGEDGKFALKAADTAQKDQSYVLYRFTQDKLAHTLMPLGGYTKEEVRKKAENLGLKVAQKPDSMEICFVENGAYAEFIKEYSGYEPKPGDFLDVNGNVIGRHKGVIYYTVGQRKGLGAYGKPMFVKSIDGKNNTVTLGEKGTEFSKGFIGGDVNFISGELPEKPICADVRIRYQARGARAEIEKAPDGVRVVFEEEQRAVTPGQAAVFYDGDTVLGGAVVESVL